MRPRIAWVVALFASALAAEDFVVFRAPGNTPREQLIRYLNSIGAKQLDERSREVARIQTREDAERRKKVIREKLLRLIGGLPEVRPPLNVKQYGTLERGAYRIEKIVYESLPGFYVTANVYVPTGGERPFPAVLMPVGHGADGKAGSQRVAVGLARKGFIALAYDPIGQGERLQYYDPDLMASKVGESTTEHSHANGHTILIGDNVARYRIWDGIRGIDYLVSRADVDPARIGCTGCSGGGTLTTYISALDYRVKVAAPSCYITSWEQLLVKLGPQDAEQSFPNFLSEGLNFADYVELFAPKPWLIVSTIDDYFPLEGARQTYEEVRRWYRLYGAQDKIDWHVGPGGHGTPQPSREAIYGWFIKWLKNGEGDPREEAAKLDPVANLLCTPTGQVADSLGGETVFSLNKRRAADLIAPKRAPDTAQLAADIRELTGASAPPGSAPPLTVHRNMVQDGYSIEVVSYESEKGIEIPGLILVPDSTGPRPAVLVVDSRPKQMAAGPGGDWEDLVKSGRLVFAIQPRGASETASLPRSPLLGESSLAMRAAVVGRTLVGMRADDIIRAMDYLASRADVDRGNIAAFGQGASGVPLLHAALLDARIRRLLLQETLTSYRTAVDRPIHRNLYEVAVPGLLRRYDLDWILAALNRPVTLINPVDALGKPVRPAELHKLLGTASDHIRLEFRGTRDSLSQVLGPLE